MNYVTRIESQKKGEHGVQWLEAPLLEEFNSHVKEMNDKGYTLINSLYANDGYTLFWRFLDSDGK
jgi:hypothetical protein